MALAEVLTAELAAAEDAELARAELRTKHERVRSALRAFELESLPAEGGLCFVAHASRPDLAGDLELAQRLLERGLASVPLCEFDPPRELEALGPAVRIGFARSAQTLARLDALVARPLADG